VLADIDLLFSCPFSNRSECTDTDQSDLNAGQFAAGYGSAELRKRGCVRLSVSDAIDVNGWITGRRFDGRVIFRVWISEHESRLTECADVGVSG